MSDKRIVIEMPPICVKPEVKRYRPLSSRVVIRMDEPITQKNGIDLTEPIYKPTGEVIEVGPGYRDAYGLLVPMEVKVGDRVYLDGNQGNWLDWENKEGDRRIFIVREACIAGVEVK